jgi:hypothetical protein
VDKFVGNYSSPYKANPQNANMLFYISLVAFLSLLIMCKLYRNSQFWSLNQKTAVTYRYRAFIVPHLPERVKALFPRLRDYTPLSTFSDQVGLGLSSNDFDIEANIRDGDSRTGLDETGTQEVLEIMRRERVK